MVEKKETKKEDYLGYLNKSKIPQNNVIDLKKLLVEQEKEEKKAEPDFFSRIYNKYSPTKIKKKEGVSKKYTWQVSWKSIMVFSSVCLVLLIPLTLLASFKRMDTIKGKVMGASVDALENLKTAGSAIAYFEIDEAKEEFLLAEQGFNKAQEELTAVNKILLFLLKLVPFKGEAIRSGEHLIEAGKKISEIGRIISEKIEPLSESSTLNNEDWVVSEVMLSLAASVDEISEKVLETKKHLERVETSSLPKEYQEEVERVKSILPDLEDYAIYLNKIFSVTTELAGFYGQKEYLFIFQNNTEIRPTGGFIGSFALVKAENGQLDVVEVPSRGPSNINDIYFEEIIPPRPLWLVNNKWQFQDSNWFPDFPSSAEKINWFYERARGYRVDGIITFTPNVITDLLKITGSITMDSYELTLNSENFVRETQEQVEIDYDKEINRPKQIIADLMPILINKIFHLNPNKFTSLIETLSASVKKRDILFYAEEDVLEEKIRQLNWAGEIKQVDRDYLMLVNTNIRGGKTDHVINQELSVQTEIDQGGSIFNTVTLRRTHQGDSEDVFTGEKNINYIRFYVPEGSSIVKAEGFEEIDQNLLFYPSEEAVEDDYLFSIEKNPVFDERNNVRITSEYGKTVFGNWQVLEAGETKEIVIKYKLPFKIGDDKDIYSLYLQKQPGLKAYEVKTEFVASETFEITETSTEEEIVSNTVKHADTLNWDKAYGVILKKK